MFHLKDTLQSDIKLKNDSEKTEFCYMC